MLEFEALKPITKGIKEMPKRIETNELDLDLIKTEQTKQNQTIVKVEILIRKQVIH